MKLIRLKFGSWQEGKDIMSKIAKLIAAEIREEDSYIKCENEFLSASCQLKYDGSSFILLKSKDELLLLELSQKIGI